MRLACILATGLTLGSAGALRHQQEPAPTAPPPASSQSDSTQPPSENPTPPAEEKKDSGTPPAKKTSTRRHRKRPPVTEGEPHKIVVHQGGASEPVAQIMPGITEEEANRQRQSAEELLAATETNLKKLEARTMNPNQQGTIGQLRQYMNGARSALKDGDTQRAHTLALKAQLLSADLVKH